MSAADDFPYMEDGRTSHKRHEAMCAEIDRLRALWDRTPEQWAEMSADEKSDNIGKRMVVWGPPPHLRVRSEAEQAVIDAAIAWYSNDTGTDNAPLRYRMVATIEALVGVSPTTEEPT